MWWYCDILWHDGFPFDHPPLRWVESPWPGLWSTTPGTRQHKPRSGSEFPCPSHVRSLSGDAFYDAQWCSVIFMCSSQSCGWVIWIWHTMKILEVRYVWRKNPRKLASALNHPVKPFQFPPFEPIIPSRCWILLIALFMTWYGDMRCIQLDRTSRSTTAMAVLYNPLKLLTCNGHNSKFPKSAAKSQQSLCKVCMAIQRSTTLAAFTTALTKALATASQRVSSCSQVCLPHFSTSGHFRSCRFGFLRRWQWNSKVLHGSSCSFSWTCYPCPFQV